MSGGFELVCDGLMSMGGLAMQSAGGCHLPSSQLRRSLLAWGSNGDSMAIQHIMRTAHHVCWLALVNKVACFFWVGELDALSHPLSGSILDSSLILCRDFNIAYVFR